jgi:hypothetical protein
MVSGKKCRYTIEDRWEMAYSDLTTDDCERLFELFEYALQSDNEAVKEVFSQLMTIAALTKVKDKEMERPLSQALANIKRLESRVDQLEHDLRRDDYVARTYRTVSDNRQMGVVAQEVSTNIMKSVYDKTVPFQWKEES